MSSKCFSKISGSLHILDEQGHPEFVLKKGHIITPTFYSLCAVKDGEEICEYLKTDIFLDKVLLLFPGIEVDMICNDVEERIEFVIAHREWRWQYVRIQEDDRDAGWFYQLFIEEKEICTFRSSTTSESEFEGTLTYNDGWSSKLGIMCGTLINALFLLKRKF